MIGEPLLSCGFCFPTSDFGKRSLVAVGLIFQAKALAICLPPGVSAGETWNLVDTAESSMHINLSLPPSTTLHEALIPMWVG